MRDDLQTARRNFPRAEYELVRDSFPETLHNLSTARLNSRIARCERLIDKYKAKLHDKESREHYWRGGEKIGSERLIRYRMNHLRQSMQKFRSELKRNGRSASESASSSSKSKTASSRNGRKRLTIKTRSASSSSPARRSRSSAMKAASSRRRAGPSSRSANSSRRRDEWQEKDEKNNLTMQPKRKLGRGGTPDATTQFRNKQRREDIPENVNPSSRVR